MAKTSRQRELETKAIEIDELELKDDDGDHPGGTLQGYASTYDLDLTNEMVVPGAFKKTIESNRGKVVVLDSHSSFGGVTNAIGRTFELEEKKRGLWFRAYFATTERAQEIRKLIREGVITKMSFGFNVILDEFDRVTRVRKLKEIKLLEISPVIFPANPATSVSAKSDDGGEVDHEKLMRDFREGLRLMNDVRREQRFKELGARSAANAKPLSGETLAKFQAATKKFQAATKTMREFVNAAALEDDPSSTYAKLKENELNPRYKRE